MNLFHFASFVISVLVFVLILRRPQWLGVRRPEITFTACLTVLGSFYLLVEKEIGRHYEYQGLAAISLILSLVGVGLSYQYRRQPDKAFKIICLSFMVIVWSLISYKMLRATNLLDWDERYYLSIAATASGGYGLYPALQNYPSIPVMGGIGHLAWLYALAYQVLGPSLYSLRFVALLFSVLSLPPIFRLFRRWYGSVTAWLAVTLLPTTLFYLTIFSIRMDIFTITCLWWALLLVDVARQKNTWRWHLAVGLFIGLCLQAHIHTSAMALSIGMLYLVDYIMQVRKLSRLVFPSAVLLYSTGALIGLGFFIIANILPNPDAFFRTAGNAGRFMVVSANLQAPLIERIIRSLTAFDILGENFIIRWIIVFQTMHPVELILWVASFLSLFWRRSHPATLPTIVLSIGSVAAGFFILNLYVLIYTAHLGPALLLSVPPFFTYGFNRRSVFEWKDVSPGFVVVVAACILPFYMTSLRFDINVAPPANTISPYAEIVNFVKDNISTKCKLIGLDGLFVFELPMYSLYHSGEAISSSSGLRFYNNASERELWQAIDPDIVLIPTSLIESLQDWLVEMEYEEIAPSIWQKTRTPLSADCVITP